MMKLDLKDKVIVVTGSARGIGAALIRRLAEENAKVVINYNTSEEEAKILAQYFDDKKIEYLLIRADLTKDDEVKEFYKAVRKKFKKVDVLINNAGICKNAAVLAVSGEQWDAVMNANLKSAFLCTKYFSKSMIGKQEGKVINISSRYGQIGAMGQASYAASKAGMTSFTKTVAKELGNYNILVNAVCPGQISTGLEEKKDGNNHEVDIKEIYDYLDRTDYLETLLNFITYMCSDAFHSITGQVFYLDARI